MPTLAKVLVKIILGVVIWAIICYVVIRRKEQKDRAAKLNEARTEHFIYNQFYGRSYNSFEYEEFLVNSSHKYVVSLLTAFMENGIDYAIQCRTDDPDKIDSIFVLGVFKEDILNHWDHYKNTSVSIPCFVNGYNMLSAVPESYLDDIVSSRNFKTYQLHNDDYYRVEDFTILYEGNLINADDSTNSETRIDYNHFVLATGHLDQKAYYDDYGYEHKYFILKNCTAKPYGLGWYQEQLVKSVK